MATIKSYTDIEQSKKLAEILPQESADCFWDYDDLQKYHRINWFEDGYEKDSQLRLNENNVCAWSLAALLSVLPEGIIENYYAPNLQKENGKYSIAYGNDELLCIADNPVDACVAMVEKLHKLNLL